MSSTDRAGENIHLHAERSPEWLAGLVQATNSGEITKRLRGRLQSAQTRPERQAAVLVLFAGELTSTLPEDARILLTHRSPHLRSHSGQIAFPGGRVDPGDVNVVDCALREAWEETGLDRMSVTPLAQLAEVPIRATGYPVHPVLAYWHNPGAVGVVDPGEADAVFEVPVSQLLDPGNRFHVCFGNWQGPAFHVDDYLIWGFTAGVLDVLFAQAGWAIPYKPQVLPLEEALAASRNQERHPTR